ncbi:MAG: S8 family serine peptidase [Acidobacteria bacterium]|nr:S8 family serine peptidase [Acidobacteriota bacterium]
MSQDPRIKSIVPDSVSESLGAVTAPDQGGIITQDFAPWGLDRIDERAFQLDGKFKYYSAGAGARIYVLDTGIRRTHEQFRLPGNLGSRAFAGKDIPTDGYIDVDINGHGTAIASVAAGNILGVAKDARVYSVRIADARLFPQPQAYRSDMIAGFNWVIQNGIRPAVINFSYSIADPNNQATDLDQVVNSAINNGFTVVVSAGNAGLNASNYTPQRLSRIICVGASNASDQRLIDGNIISNTGTSLDLFAPGKDINVASAAADTGAIGYDIYRGTSIASPFVTGVAAVFLARMIPALPVFVETTLIRNATPNRLNAATLGAGSPNRLLYSRFRSVASVNAASYGNKIAPNSIVALFGEDLGATVAVRVNNTLATILGVSPTQINFVVPSTNIGQAVVDIYASDGAFGSGVVEVATVAPGLFSTSGDGQGLASAILLRIRQDGSQSYESVAVFDSALNRYVAVPIDFGPSTDQLFLILYGTGIRGTRVASAPPTGVGCTVGGLNVSVLYANLAPGYQGLDQVNVALPRSLAGRGQLDVIVTVDGQLSNAVAVTTR